MSRGFNGSSDQIQAGLATAQHQQVSAALWVYQINATGTSGVLFHVGDINNNGWGMFVRNTGLFLYEANVAFNTYTALSNNVWTHVAAVNTGTGSSPNWLVYVNGVVQGGAYTPSDYVTPTGSTWFGASTSAFFFDGNLADAGIWTIPLSAAEVAALANGARPGAIRPASLVGWWPFDGLQSPEPDLSGDAFNGTLTGTSQQPGPPVMMFTPRWPQFLASAAAPAAPSFGWFGGFPGPQPLFVPPGIRQQSPAMTMQPPTTVTTIIPVFNPGFPNIFRRDKSVN